MSITNLSDYSQHKTNSRIEHMPVSMFAIIIGIAGLAIAWHKAYEVTTAPILISKTLTIAASLLFIFLIILYGIKILLFPKAIYGELTHPVRNSFFATISISFLLLAIAWLPNLPHIAFIAWVIGSSLHLFITIRIISSWIYRTHYEIKHANPAWFMPVVGNIIVPIIGIKIAPIEISWFFFSIGIFFWLILLSIILNRLFFYEPLPERLIPTFFILLAPPSIGSIAWSSLIGRFDDFSHVLYYIALFMFLILINNAKRFLINTFFISAWAYSFPLVAFTLATLQMAKFSNLWFFFWLGNSMLYISSIIVLMLFIRTIIAILRKEICLPE
jgi:tellurite resistance protein